MPSPDPDPAPEPALIDLCAAGDVPPDCGKRVDVAGFPPLAVFAVGGEYFVTDDLCTHGAASLADGYLSGDQVECPWHSGRFCVRTGEATEYPAEAPLRTYRVHLRDGRVCIEACGAAGRTAA